MGRYVTCGPGLGMGMIIACFQWAGSRPRRRDLFISARRRRQEFVGDCVFSGAGVLGVLEGSVEFLCGERSICVGDLLCCCFYCLL